MSRGAPTSTAGRDGSLVRAALLWWLPLALLILAGVYVVYVNEGRHSLMELRQGQRGRLRLHTQRIASEIKQVMADCLVHAQLLESLHWGKGLSQRDQKEMAWAFASLLRRKEAYDQVRILDEYGREILRVEQGPEGPLVAARELFQDKSTRPYFRQGMSLERGGSTSPSSI